MYTPTTTTTIAGQSTGLSGDDFTNGLGSASIGNGVVNTTGGSATAGSVDVGSGAADSGAGDGLSLVLVLPWADGGTIDAAYTCHGADESPAVSWLGAPAEAVEMALVVTDSDANDFVHWIIAGLDPKNPTIPRNNPPISAIEGQNGYSTAAAPSIGWKGPCPPTGATHHYRFTLYALSQQVELPTGSSATDLLSVIEGSAIASAESTALSSTP